MTENNILIYLLRRDLRVADNPILHHVASSKHDFTHLLPVYVFPAQQMEVSGFIKDGSKSPYPSALSPVGGYWRCGPHRARLIAQSVWDVKTSLESIGSGLAVRVGMVGDVIGHLLDGFKSRGHKVGAVWMIKEEGVEEARDERDVAASCKEGNIPMKLWEDEKYFIDDRDLNFDAPRDLPDIFTTYRKSVEPLREKPRAALPRPKKSSLPPMPEGDITPQQHGAFATPSTYEELETSLLFPIKDFMDAVPPFPEGAVSPHPFKGGETVALERLNHLIASGVMTNYKDTRNGLIGADFSTKLSAYLAQGCVTARQMHEAMLGYENGTMDVFKDAEGYGKGENEGTKAVRFELLWRDYMRLCTKKFKHRLFRQEGFRDGEHGKKTVWKSALPAEAAPNQTPNPRDIAKIIERFNGGTTGMGLIDASQRELIHTGYTSNRARQNVASFLAKHLGIDWRYGAEWYEMLLVDYDVNSNWANWQYVAGVGNDPRGEARIFNPVKQAFDYDKEGKYVRMWVPEVRKLDKLENVFQAWTSSPEDLETAGLTGSNMVTDPVKRIEFSVAGKPRTSRRPFVRRVRANSGRYHNGNGHGDAQNDGSDGQSGSPTSPRKSGFGGSPPSFDVPRGPRGRGGARGGGRGNGVSRDWGYNNGRGNSYGNGYNNGFRAGFRAGYPAVAPGMGPMPVRATWSVGGQSIG